MAVRVLLGPEFDLHRGVHYSLASNPPPGFEYAIVDARHSFLFPSKPASPFEEPHWGEFVSFGPGSELAHTSRWPVLERRAWIADTDDFGYPVFSGRHALAAEFRECFRQPWTAGFRRNVLCRAINMLSAYAHPSCKTVFFRSGFALARARKWIAEMGFCGAPAEAFLAKTGILYPAQQPCPPEIVRKKWDLPGPMRVLFIGREFDTKNGRIALQAFAAAARGMPMTEFTYVGNIAPEAAAAYTSLLSKIEYHSTLERAETLALLSRSHILFHPSKFEGFGTVFVEAAAMGLAVIVASGGDMAHIREIFDDSGALMVDRDRISEVEEPAVFESHLRRLLNEPELARSLALRNYELTVSGSLSMVKRNQTLSSAYERALAESAAEPLAIRDLPYARLCMETSMTTREVEAAEKTFRDQHRLTQRRFLV